MAHPNSPRGMNDIQTRIHTPLELVYPPNPYLTYHLSYQLCSHYHYFYSASTNSLLDHCNKYSLLEWHQYNIGKCALMFPVCAYIPVCDLPLIDFTVGSLCHFGHRSLI